MLINLLLFNIKRKKTQPISYSQIQMNLFSNTWSHTAFWVGNHSIAIMSYTGRLSSQADELLLREEASLFSALCPGGCLRWKAAQLSALWFQDIRRVDLQLLPGKKLASLRILLACFNSHSSLNVCSLDDSGLKTKAHNPFHNRRNGMRSPVWSTSSLIPAV